MNFVEVLLLGPEYFWAFSFLEQRKFTTSKTLYKSESQASVAALLRAMFMLPCNSGSPDKDGVVSIAEAFFNHTGKTTTGYQTPAPHNGWLNFNDSNTPSTPEAGQLTPPKGPLYLVPMDRPGHGPITFSK